MFKRSPDRSICCSTHFSTFIAAAMELPQTPFPSLVLPEAYFPHSPYTLPTPAWFWQTPPGYTGNQTHNTSPRGLQTRPPA